jgi:hypothetical protein
LRVNAPAADPLPPPIRARFAALQYAGALEGSFDLLCQGEAGEVAHGTWIRLQLGLLQGRVAAARFTAYGCPWTLATCDWLCERLVGAAAPAPDEPSWRGGPLSWAQELGVPEARLARLLVLEDALRSAWQSRAP